MNEPIHAALIAEFYSPRARVKAFGIHSLANPAGIMFGAVLAGFIADQLGWRVPFFVLAIPTLVLLVLAARLKEPAARTVGGDRGARGAAPARGWPGDCGRCGRSAISGSAWRSPPGRYSAWATLSSSSSRRSGDVRPGQRSLLFAAGTAISIAGVIIGTTVMQRRIDARPSDGMRILCWSGVLAGIALAILPIAPSLPRWCS